MTTTTCEICGEPGEHPRCFESGGCALRVAGGLSTRLWSILKRVQEDLFGVDDTGESWWLDPSPRLKAVEFIERAVFEALARRAAPTPPPVLEFGAFIDRLIELARATAPERVADVHMSFAAFLKDGRPQTIVSLYVNGWKCAEGESASSRSAFTMLAADLHGNVRDQARALERAAEAFSDAAAGSR